MPIPKEAVPSLILGKALARNIAERDKALAAGKDYVAHPHQNSIDALRLEIENRGLDPDEILKKLALEPSELQ